MFDNLRDDETRSEEGSTMGSDTADFFVDDDAPVRVLGSDGVADILDKDDSDVPYPPARTTHPSSSLKHLVIW
jgi:hypothetical protein